MPENFEKIRENIKNIQNKITAAALRAKRDPKEITLLAATKTIDPEHINFAISCGITDIGENRVQEFTEKQPFYAKARLHFIGALQTNKVKYIIKDCDLIHSVDSEKLALEIEKRAQKLEKIQDVLVEVNISEEAQKSGILIEDLRGFLLKLSKFSNLKVRGLMCVPKNSDNEEDLRAAFRIMHKLFVDINKEKLDNISMDVLSMGMSGDFEIAIEEGATMVRIGSAIFGKRI